MPHCHLIVAHKNTPERFAHADQARNILIGWHVLTHLFEQHFLLSFVGTGFIMVPKHRKRCRMNCRYEIHVKLKRSVAEDYVTNTKPPYVPGPLLLTFFPTAYRRPAALYISSYRSFESSGIPVKILFYENLLSYEMRIE